MSIVQQAIEKIDAFNLQDPHTVEVDGKNQPKEFIESIRMSEMIALLSDSPSDAVQIAARSQHVGRWLSPRSDYPMDRPGYLKWRTELGKKHAQITREILEELNAEQALIEKIEKINLKRGIKSDPEVQLIEDALCLCFLKYHFEDFLRKTKKDKLIPIIEKTWAKMSEQGHDIALTFQYSDEAVSWIKKALKL